MKNNIREARISYAMTLPGGRFTQNDAASAFGVSLSMYKKWEQGKSKMNGEQLCAIADLYGCSTDYLLCRTDVPDFKQVRGPVGLDDTEREIIRAYRSTDPRGKQSILRTARGESGVERETTNGQRRMTA